MKVRDRYFTASAASLAILLGFGCTKQGSNESPENTGHAAVGAVMGLEQGYTVSGQVVYRASRQWSFTFKLAAAKDRWAMEFTAIPFDGVRYIQNCDGSNLVAITYFEKTSNRPTVGFNSGSVEIHTRRTPIEAPMVAHAVFVGFAGQFYLPTGTNGLLCPLWHPEREVNQVAFVNSDWQLMAPGRPEVIRCWHDADKWNEILKKPRGSGLGESNQTSLVATYSAVGKTNFGGEVFPAAFAFKAFAPDREDGKDKSLPVYEIHITNVLFRAGVEEQLFNRTVKGVAAVDDYRESRNGFRSYYLTNAAPPQLPQGAYFSLDSRETQSRLGNPRDDERQPHHYWTR
jgi:hypothetical protein